MTYTVNLDRDAGTYNIENDSGQEIDSGSLPLTQETICRGILNDKGVGPSVRDAVLGCLFHDWEIMDQ